mmetsp:Transcript_31687/g.32280  ORF Transcript_31687/g.32280 Transcript_31687/m.32280 type:complete len:267 (+) Transcript_31687:245-1045(+)
MLRSRVVELQDQLECLQRAVGIDYIPGKTKVLHIADNPYASARQQFLKSRSDMTEEEHRVNIFDEVKRLRTENRRLQALCIQHTEEEMRSRCASSAGSGGAGTGSAAGSGETEGEGETETEALGLSMNMSSFGNSTMNTSTTGGGSATSVGIDSAKMNKRLKEMFRERISCFREAVYLLTGYKVDLFTAESSSSSLPKLKLRSMYAEDPEDCLLFQWKGEILELLETPFASKLDPKLFSFLTRCNSVPAFLSNVTLDLFEKVTFLG